MIYCVVPPPLAPELHDALRRFYLDDASVEVVVERRTGEPRRSPERRRAHANGKGTAARKGKIGSADRRLIRNRHGRRVGERRATLVPVSPARLPPEALPFIDELTFVERVEPVGQREEDLDTGRLVTRLQAGEEAAFTELYLRYFDRVYGYLRVALKDVHEAEDAAQQVFIKVLEALPQYERRSQPFRAWLFRIVRNYAVDHLRKRDGAEVSDPTVLERHRSNGDQLDPGTLAWLPDSHLLLFIDRLPLAQRQVVALRYMLGFENDEIAQIVGRSPDSVRQLQHRALRFLESRLSRLGREKSAGGDRVPFQRLFRKSPVRPKRLPARLFTGAAR